MRLTIEKDDGTTEVFQNILDLYVVVRREEKVLFETDKLGLYLKTTSHSYGSNVRELVKEVQQSLVELQDFLREQRNGGTP
jgi:hypothetical protein